MDTKKIEFSQHKIKLQIKAAMAEQDISLYRLAKITDIARHLLSAYLNGKNNTTDKSLIKICQALNIKNIEI